MPQLNFPDFVPQLIWLAITFIGLYMLMTRVALPKIGGIIEQRRDRIASDIDEAERLREQGEAAEAAYETSLAEARAKAHEAVQQQRNKLKEEIEEKRADLDKQMADKIAEAEKRIDAARAAASSQIRDVAADAAADIVKKLVGTTPTKKAVETAIKAAGKG